MSRLVANTYHPVNNHYNSNPDTIWKNLVLLPLWFNWRDSTRTSRFVVAIYVKLCPCTPWRYSERMGSHLRLKRHYRRCTEVFTHQPFYASVRSFLLPCNGRLCESQSRSGHLGGETCLPLPGIERRFICSADRIVVTILDTWRKKFWQYWKSVNCHN